MTCDDAAYDDSDADFQRWYFGGSPPESADWPRHAFEDALHGAPFGSAPGHAASCHAAPERHQGA